MAAIRLPDLAVAAQPLQEVRALVVGLGYVGLPLAVALAEHYPTTGFDINLDRITALRGGRDHTGEVDPERLARSRLDYHALAQECPPADIYVITVPTPIDAHNNPDLRPLIAATRTVARMIDPARKPIIVYESTVYPGVTETVCRPLLASESGLVAGRDFFVGYSPERINPGDRVHTVDKIVKVVSGENEEVTNKVAAFYEAITTGGVFRARSIRVAEAAKVIENAQRDINIAFVNEVAQILSRMEISVWDVLATARTKWNFLPFEPGFVGGHCIGVDPFYLSHCAQELGHDAQVILAGRSTNDGMAEWVADQIHRRQPRLGSVLVLGLAFKENVSDVRNSKVAEMAQSLSRRGFQVTVADPLVDPREAMAECGLTPIARLNGGSYDCVVGAVGHEKYRQLAPPRLDRLVRPGGLLVDLKNMWPGFADGSVSLSDAKRFWSI